MIEAVQHGKDPVGIIRDPAKNEMLSRCRENFRLLILKVRSSTCVENSS